MVEGRVERTNQHCVVGHEPLGSPIGQNLRNLTCRKSSRGPALISFRRAVFLSPIVPSIALRQKGARFILRT
jgi:hypothetical protein